jgi:hypothetical protein
MCSIDMLMNGFLTDRSRLRAHVGRGVLQGRDDELHLVGVEQGVQRQRQRAVADALGVRQHAALAADRVARLHVVELLVQRMAVCGGLDPARLQVVDHLRARACVKRLPRCTTYSIQFTSSTSSAVYGGLMPSKLRICS